ncbi:MAG: transglutaminase-like domain-containing protein [Lachnospiraceae bacterium]|nr:transglutaminase-like domain-containing protein [Lachnospiraceae bacterium]
MAKNKENESKVKEEEVKSVEIAAKTESKDKSIKVKTGVSVAATFAVILSACCLVGIAYLIITTGNQNASTNKFIKGQIDRQLKEDEKTSEYIEDGFLVGEEYEIKSTKAISDAYLSGDASGLSEQDKKLYDMAVEILERETKGLTDTYSKEKAIYEWIYDNIKTSGGSTVVLAGDDANTYTPLGVLTGKKAVCVGYATTFRMFMQMLGLEVHIVHNDYHSWDMVKLDDGKWYQTDIYTDVSSSHEYVYFNVNDTFMKEQNDYDASSLPAADGTKYCYANQEAVEIADMYDIPKAVKKMIKNKESINFFRFKTKPSEVIISATEMMVGGLNSAFSELGNEDFLNGAYLSSNWYKGENDSIIVGIAYITAENGGEYPDVDKETKKKIEDSINSTFKTSVIVGDGEYGGESANAGDVSDEGEALEEGSENKPKG